MEWNICPPLNFKLSTSTFVIKVQNGYKCVARNIKKIFETNDDSIICISQPQYLLQIDGDKDTVKIFEDEEKRILTTECLRWTRLVKMLQVNMMNRMIVMITLMHMNPWHQILENLVLKKQAVMTHVLQMRFKNQRKSDY